LAADFVRLDPMTSGVRIAFGIFFLFICAIHSQQAAPPPDPDKDSETSNLLREAQKLLKEKKLPDAIEKCDQIIASFKAHYGNRKEKVYCARTSAESLGYMLKAAAEIDKGTSQNTKAIALSPTWAEAYFNKAYALQDLGRTAEAKSNIMLAVELSPWNCKYLCELGSVYKLEKNWLKAKEVFELAEDQAPIGPDEVKAIELGQARRGLGYVLVELGKLDEAEQKYQQCLAADPKDTRAAAELEYVRGLRAKAKTR
jgi:tetratricopeptide (TPR) repeat protein